EDPAKLAMWDNVAYAMQQAPALLRQFSFPPEKIPAVIEAIRTHLPSSKPTAFEGMLLRDADILEQLGAIAVLRTVSKIGRDTRFVRFADALLVLERNLAQLPNQLKLPAARRLAEPRIKILREFLQASRTELGASESQNIVGDDVRRL